MASDPKEYLIGYECKEVGSLGEREQSMYVYVRDPNISETRLNEILEIANQKIT